MLLRYLCQKMTSRPNKPVFRHPIVDLKHFDSGKSSKKGFVFSKAADFIGSLAGLATLLKSVFVL